MKIQTYVNRGTGQVVYAFQYDMSSRELDDDGFNLPESLNADKILKHGVAGDRHLVSGQFVKWNGSLEVEIYEKKAFEAAFSPLHDEDIRCIDLMMEQVKTMRTFARHVRLGLAAVTIPRTLEVRVNGLLDAVDSFDTLLREDNRRQAAAADAADAEEEDPSWMEE